MGNYRQPTLDQAFDSSVNLSKTFPSMAIEHLPQGCRILPMQAACRIDRPSSTFYGHELETSLWTSARATHFFQSASTFLRGMKNTTASAVMIERNRFNRNIQRLDRHQVHLSGMETGTLPRLVRRRRNAGSNDRPDAVRNSDDGALLGPQHEATSRSSFGPVTYKNPLVLPSLTKRHNVAHNRLREGHQTATANAGESAECDKLTCRPGQGGGQRAHEEDSQTGQQHFLARPDIGETTVDQLKARRSAASTFSAHACNCSDTAVELLSTHRKYALAIQEVLHPASTASPTI